MFTTVSKAVSVDEFAGAMDCIAVDVPGGVYSDDFDYHVILRNGCIVGGMVTEYWHSGVRCVWFDTSTDWVDDGDRATILRNLMRRFIKAPGINWVGVMLNIEDKSQHQIINEFMETALAINDTWATGKNMFFRLWPNHQNVEFRCCKPVIRNLSPS
jgi:hypothetical protein